MDGLFFLNSYLWSYLFMFGLDLVTVGGLLILASNSIQCAVPKAPQININPVTSEIQYNFSHSSEELSAVRSGTVNPYAPNVDTTTGGLRYDRPKIQTSISWGTRTYTQSGAVCLWYDTINVSIALQPQIFVSRDYKSRACQDAIVKHEERHVQVDREVINKHALKLWQALQATVRDVGALGPFNVAQQENMQTMLVTHIENTIKAQELLLTKDMQARQAAVDSLSEYEAISKICHTAERKTRAKR